MPSKTINVPEIGEINISKRRGQKTIRISLHGSSVRVSQPAWLPYSAGESFVKSRVSWVLEHIKPQENFQDGQQIGIRHTLKFVPGDSLKYRNKDNLLEITYPQGTGKDALNKFISEKVEDVLRKEAESYLPERTTQLADMFNFKFSKVSVRKLKRRWGSCNSKKQIIFNYRLMSLDTLHIDYVILHELTHTVHMNHGPDFWAHMESVLANSKRIAKTVRRAS